MGLFSRACKSCGKEPGLRVADHVAGEYGGVAVELTNFPYKACDCGRVAKWAFDPGGDLSTELFWSERGIALAEGSGGGSRCARCGTALGPKEPVELAAEAHVGGGVIGFRARLNGYVCSSCGLEQAPGGSFDIWRSGPGAEGAEALKNAVRTLGLDV